MSPDDASTIMRLQGEVEERNQQIRSILVNYLMRQNDGETRRLAPAGETKTLAFPTVLTHACISGACGQCYDEPDSAA